ncbi:hypothetical protein J7T55_013082 [Diaporthe amygdali]|uniref:uncharacterized protein n=1 Tax=Phomopsis amygdali TaxID=1214568 RepID=UPI0022FE0C8D|nr:uncharacterized protein J7T55_013082 [Diaporthe amygdali]KAJ0118827.1 hypothetical protein J7T55_013082 [Diaporthe amygdali]
MIGQSLNDDVLYVVANSLDVESMLKLANTSRSLYNVISPAALRKDLCKNGRSIFSATRNNDFLLLEKVLRSPVFDINKSYQREGKTTSVLQYAVEHASEEVFKILTVPVLFQAFLDYTDSHPWINDQGGRNNILGEAIRHGRSDLISYIVESLNIQSLPPGWPTHFDPRQFWDLDDAPLVAGLSGRKTAIDPETIRMLSRYSDPETFVGVNGNPHCELKSYYPEAPYVVAHASPDRLRQWTSNSLHIAMMLRQHPEARNDVRLETLEAWLDAGVPVNQPDGGLVDLDHVNPLVSYFRTPLDFAAEGLDLEAMDFLIRRGAVANILGVDNGSLTASTRFTDLTTMSLLFGHRLWPHSVERGCSILVPNRDIRLPAGSTYKDMISRMHQERTFLKAAAPGLKNVVYAVEEQIHAGMRLLEARIGQHHLPLVMEESSGLPVEVFSFIHDELLGSPDIADSLTRLFGSSWIDTMDWNLRTPLLQILSGIAPVDEHKFWSMGNNQAWYIRQTLHKPQLIRWLLENGANPNACDIEGITPLRYALFRLDVGAVDLLLRHGADTAEVSDLIHLLLNFNRQELLHNANDFMKYALELCFVGIRDGFVRRIGEQVREWDQHRMGVVGVQLQTADGETTYSITVPSTPLDSCLGLFLDTPLCLGSRLEDICLVGDIDSDRRETFICRLSRLRYVLQSHCNYRPVPGRKRRTSAGSFSIDEGKSPPKRHRAM